MHIFHTGVAVEFTLEAEPELKWGFLVKERSSLARKGLFILGGVIDAGYRGELVLMLGNMGDEDYQVTAGDKIANLIPIPVAAKTLEVVSQLSLALRGEAAFGSTGQ
jgi:dUTP diphosphatase